MSVQVEEHSIAGEERSGVGEERPIAAAEAILFAMGEPVSLHQLSMALHVDMRQTKAIMDALMSAYNSDAHGISVIQIEEKYQMVTKKKYYENLIVLASHPTKPRLTEVLLETLSIIAYKQPVTKAEIEQIRGVSSDHAVNKLVSYELVQESGRLDAPGRPILFTTTDRFLKYFGLSSKDELPELSAVQMADLQAEAEAEIPEMKDAAESAEIPESEDAPESAEMREKDAAETITESNIDSTQKSVSNRK